MRWPALQVAAGTIDGKHWQIRLRPGKSWRRIRQCEPAYLAVFDPQLVGQVRANVTEVSVRLSDGDAVRLRRCGRTAGIAGRRLAGGQDAPDGVTPLRGRS